VLQKLLAEANGQSLNCVTVDGDTSTSDTCLMFATGDKKLGGAPLRSLDDKRLGPLRAALADLMQDLAVQVASDGEGVSKLITIDVAGAENDAAARQIGLAIGNSPLVKTAVAGEDANWGRIVMAIGKSGEAAERDRLSIDIGGVQVARKGRAVAGYDERPVAKHMRGAHVHIRVDVGVQVKSKNKASKNKAKGQVRIWASDLTHGYIDINADYRS
jgi:glutamate N-acetyltransferase/amino-acid N-acetyltransferase